MDVHPATGRAALTVSGAADADALPDRELPDSPSWAWAHVAVAGGITTAQLEAENSDRARARRRAGSVCPRRLHPGRRYCACVVPAFKAGPPRPASAGGRDDGQLDARVGGGRRDAVELPVYHSWEFMTGAGGDFASLALRLEGPRKLPAGAGRAPDGLQRGRAAACPASRDRCDRPDRAGGRAEAGRLRTVRAGTAARRRRSPRGIAQLIARAERSARAAAVGSLAGGAAHVAGRRRPRGCASSTSTPATAPPPGLGARVIHEQREQLMAAGLEAGRRGLAGEPAPAPGPARARTEQVRCTCNAMPATSDGTFLQITRPMHDRVAVGKTGRGRHDGGRRGPAELAARAPARRCVPAARAFARTAAAAGSGATPGTPAGCSRRRPPGTIAATPPAAPPAGAGTIAAGVGTLARPSSGCGPGSPGSPHWRTGARSPRADATAGPTRG